MGTTWLDLAGQRFGRLLVLSRGPRDRQGNAQWECVCDCGTATVVRGFCLRDGNTQSCGCLNREASVVKNTVHGGAGAGRTTPEYRAWQNMKTRCFNPNFTTYEDYGGRGITVCSQWVNDFPAFLAHVGPKPSPAHSLDRIDNEGHYEPGNVRWASRSDQNRNRRPWQYVAC
jgi:hypothetical protein